MGRQFNQTERAGIFECFQRRTKDLLKSGDGLVKNLWNVAYYIT